MSSAKSLFESFIIMLILILVAVILLFAVGVPTDNLFTGFIGTGFIEDVPAQWDTFEDRDIVISAFYAFDYSLIIAGVLNFLATAVRRQRYDDEYYVPRY